MGATMSRDWKGGRRGRDEEKKRKEEDQEEGEGEVSDNENSATVLGFVHKSHSIRSVEWVGQMKRWKFMGSLGHPGQANAYSR